MGSRAAESGNASAQLEQFVHASMLCRRLDSISDIVP